MTSLLAAETFEPGFLTRNVWVIVLLPVISFVVTLFFGKRMPRKGIEPGVALVGLALLLSIGLGIEWAGRGSVPYEEGGDQAVAATYRGTSAGDHEKPIPGADSPEGEHALGVAPLTDEHGTEPAAGEGGEHAEEHGHAVKVRPYYEKEWKWFEAGGSPIGVGFRVDGFTVIMLFTVSVIAFCVHLFSTAYMEDDVRKTHYFASLGLFTSGMYILVTASTTVALLVGWEIMGLCSFMLIGHWWEEKRNSDAALKAFFTTRTGDIGLLVGISILFFIAGQTFNIGRTNQLAAGGGLDDGFLLLAAVALLVACIGKSAQFPLHTWLPDAMAGPTPVSALIHAATMVVAGVYMVARLYPVFFEAFRIAENALGFNPVALVGGVTIIIAGLLAFVQNDIKKVLAYSTVSQLGYMVMGLGVGAWTGAVFHLFTHAFFKGLLFLGAGSVSHACHHSFDMRDYGGLRKYMPKTFWTFLIGTLALMGLPILAGFWSKDEILLGAWTNGYRGTFFIVGSVGAALTCAYMVRVLAKTFWGEYRGPQTAEAIEHARHAEHGHGHEDPHVVPSKPQRSEGATRDHAPQAESHAGLDEAQPDVTTEVTATAPLGGWPHESPWPMTACLILLAGFSVVAGIINAPFAGLQFTHFSAIEPIVAAGVPEPSFNWAVAIISTGGAVAGLGLAYAWWFAGIRFGLDGLTERNRVAGALYRFVERKYYLDDLYEKVIVNGIKGPIAQAAYWTNQNIIDGIVNGAGWLAVRTGDAVYDHIDQRVVDGTVNGVGAGARGLGRGFGVFASGRVQQYAAYLIGGAAAGGIIILLVLGSQ